MEIGRIYINKEQIGIANINFYIESQFLDNVCEYDCELKKSNFKFNANRICLYNSSGIIEDFGVNQTLPFDLVHEFDGLIYVFENCWISICSPYVFSFKDYETMQDVFIESEKLTIYTKERYKTMECNNGKCTPVKQDMKDKAIKMLRESFEKHLKSIEKLACRKSSPATEKVRKELLDKFEEYLRELLVC